MLQGNENIVLSNCGVDLRDLMAQTHGHVDSSCWAMHWMLDAGLWMVTDGAMRLIL